MKTLTLSLFTCAVLSLSTAAFAADPAPKPAPAAPDTKTPAKKAKKDTHAAKGGKEAPAPVTKDAPKK